MTNSIGYLDFSRDVLFEESLVIFSEMNGFFTKDDLENMEFDRYEKIVEKTKEIMRMKNGSR